MGGVGLPGFLGRGVINDTEYNGKPQRPSLCDACGKEEFIQYVVVVRIARHALLDRIREIFESRSVQLNNEAWLY